MHTDTITGGRRNMTRPTITKTSVTIGNSKPLAWPPAQREERGGGGGATKRERERERGRKNIRERGRKKILETDRERERER